MIRRIGFIGAGRIAEQHASVIKAKGHEVCAVSCPPGSQTMQSFAQKYGVKESFNDPMKLIERESPDALVVCTPWNVTQDIIPQLIQTGIPMMIEKPVALSSKRIADILENCSTKHVMVGYNRRFYDFIPGLKEQIQNNPLHSVSLSLPESVQALEKRHSADMRSSILLYMSSHWLDLTRYLIGDFEVCAMTKNVNVNGQICGYHGLFKASRLGTPIHYRSDFDAPQNISIEFTFKDSIWRLSPIEKLTVVEGMNCIEPSSASPTRQYLPNIVREVQSKSRYKPGFDLQWEYFIKRYIDQVDVDPIGATMHDALAITRLCEDIGGSADSVQISD
jgi:predicted dehydrogenase